MSAEKPARPIIGTRIVPPGGDEEAAARRMDLFEVEIPIRKLSDLVVPGETMTRIRALLTKIRYRKVLYEDFGLAKVDPYGGRTALNLYGPPGTGKSFAADAIANELGMGIIRANYAEIESKFVGETAKNIKAAFRKAHEAGALLFFDEADSILGRRLANVTQSTDHAVNVSRSVMLLELDRFDGVTVFATNLASNYDTAFIRRILGHIEMPLPGADLRRKLWAQLVPEEMPVARGEGLFERLAADSEGLSGGDILNVVISAASAALEREGPGCEVQESDFRAGIAAVRSAQAQIGTPDH